MPFSGFYHVTNPNKNRGGGSSDKEPPISSGRDDSESRKSEIDAERKRAYYEHKSQDTELDIIVARAKDEHESLIRKRDEERNKKEVTPPEVSISYGLLVTKGEKELWVPLENSQYKYYDYINEDEHEIMEVASIVGEQQGQQATLKSISPYELQFKLKDTKTGRVREVSFHNPTYFAVDSNYDICTRAHLQELINAEFQATNSFDYALEFYYGYAQENLFPVLNLVNSSSAS